MGSEVLINKQTLVDSLCSENIVGKIYRPYLVGCSSQYKLLRRKLTTYFGPTSASSRASFIKTSNFAVHVLMPESSFVATMQCQGNSKSLEMK